MGIQKYQKLELKVHLRHYYCSDSINDSISWKLGFIDGFNLQLHGEKVGNVYKFLRSTEVGNVLQKHVVFLRSSSRSRLGSLSLYKFWVQWYSGWDRGQKLNHKVTKWDKELSPWETLQSTWSTSPELWAPAQPQGHTPARKHAPGYANSQQKFRELVQAGMTPKNRIQAHAGGNVPQSDWADGAGPWKREVQGQLTQPLCAPKLACTEGLKVWSPAEGGQ